LRGREPMKVRLCDKNKGKGKIEKRLLDKFPEIDVKVKKCIDVCGDCEKSMVARIDGKKVVAGDKEELYGKIVRKLKKD
jgi:uncharacterized protein YuzB (UPF0349 family)